MTNSELIRKLQTAQDLMSDVYHWASEKEVDAVFTRNQNVAQLLSVADSCVIDAIEALHWDEE